MSYIFGIHLVSNNIGLLQYTSHVRFARMRYSYATSMTEANEAEEGKRHNEILCHMTTKKRTEHEGSMGACGEPGDFFCKDTGPNQTVRWDLRVGQCSQAKEQR